MRKGKVLKFFSFIDPVPGTGFKKKSHSLLVVFSPLMVIPPISQFMNMTTSDMKVKTQVKIYFKTKIPIEFIVT
jgi:hypothetical protein